MSDHAERLERAKEAIRAGRWSFNHPRARECFPLTKGASKLTEYEFLYLDAECFGAWEGHHQGGFVIHWGIKGTGFGEITFCKRLDGEWEIDSEEMGEKFVKAALNELFDSLPKP